MTLRTEQEKFQKCILIYYIYYDKGKRQLLIVDHYDYGDTPIVQINILQSLNKSISTMKVHPNLYLNGAPTF